MRILVQRVKCASVKVDGKCVGRIEKGFVLFVGFTFGDNLEKVDYLINKVVNLRIFDDNCGIMNLSLKDVGGSVLSISQFTLYADASNGNRPSYSKALKSFDALPLYDYFNTKLGDIIPVEKGIFGEDMKVELVNDGPVTIMLER